MARQENTAFRMARAPLFHDMAVPGFLPADVDGSELMPDEALVTMRGGSRSRCSTITTSAQFIETMWTRCRGWFPGIRERARRIASAKSPGRFDGCGTPTSRAWTTRTILHVITFLTKSSHDHAHNCKGKERQMGVLVGCYLTSSRVRAIQEQLSCNRVAGGRRPEQAMHRPMNCSIR